MATKRTKLEQSNMEQKVYELLMNGNSYRNILKYLMEKYQYSKPNAEKIYLKVIRSFKVTDKVEQEDLINKYTEMLMDLYNTAIIDKNGRLALSVMENIIKLQGLGSININQKVTTPIQIKYIVPGENNN